MHVIQLTVSIPHVVTSLPWQPTVKGSPQIKQGPGYDHVIVDSYHTRNNQLGDAKTYMSREKEKAMYYSVLLDVSKPIFIREKFVSLFRFATTIDKISKM